MESMDSLLEVKTEIQTEYSDTEEDGGIRRIWIREPKLELCNNDNVETTETTQQTQGLPLQSDSFECQFCSCCLNSEEYKNKHEMYCSKRSKEMNGFHAYKKSEPGLQTPEVFSCDECQFKTNRNLYLKRHINSMHKNELHSCKLCDFKTRHRSSLVKHKHTHNKVGRFLCKFCTKSFHHKQVWDAHMLINHKSEVKDQQEILTNKVHSCTVCSYETVRSSTFALHMGTHYRDSKTKRFMCYHCDYASSQKSHLVRHMGTHLDVRQYACASCGRAFRRKERLDGHILNMHKDEKALLSTISHKINQCSKCAFVSIEKSKMIEHFRVHEKE